MKVVFDKETLAQEVSEFIRFSLENAGPFAQGMKPIALFEVEGELFELQIAIESQQSEFLNRDKEPLPLTIDIQDDPD